MSSLWVVCCEQIHNKFPNCAIQKGQNDIAVTINIIMIYLYGMQRRRIGDREYDNRMRCQYWFLNFLVSQRLPSVCHKSVYMYITMIIIKIACIPVCQYTSILDWSQASSYAAHEYLK